MNNNIIKGTHIAESICKNLSLETIELKDKYKAIPTLAIILVGDDSASLIYIRNKINAANKIGINTHLIQLSNSVKLEQLYAEINILNNDEKISGIIVQLPLPDHIDKNLIITFINPLKDVDGFHPLNVGYLQNNIKGGFIPCTAIGCLKLLKTIIPKLSGKHAVIIGRSNIVGRPLSNLLLNENCTITVCHSKTQDLEKITQAAHIIISAAGSPEFLGPQYFNSSSIVIDIGMNRNSITNKIVGDVDFEKVQKIVQYITPVPGGVGPMTVACLLMNTIKAYKKHYE